MTGEQSQEELERLLGVLASLSSALTGDDSERRQLVVPATSGDSAHGTAKAEARYRALVEQIPAITFTVSLEEGAPEIYIGPQIEQIRVLNERLHAVGQMAASIGHDLAVQAALGSLPNRRLDKPVDLQMLSRVISEVARNRRQ